MLKLFVDNYYNEIQIFEFLIVDSAINYKEQEIP